MVAERPVAVIAVVCSKRSFVAPIEPEAHRTCHRVTTCRVCEDTTERLLQQAVGQQIALVARARNLTKLRVK